MLKATINYLSSQQYGQNGKDQQKRTDESNKESCLI